MNYLDKDEFYKEVIISKARGILSKKCSNMLQLLGTNLMNKPPFNNYKNPDDKYDCYQTAMYVLYKNWYLFNEDKTKDPFSYYTEIFKRAIAQGFNDLHLKKGDKGNDIRVISIESSNKGVGLHSL